MLQYTAGTDLTLTFAFFVDNEYVVPSSASFNLRNHLGAIVATGDIALTASSTEAPVTTLAANNTIADGVMFENRTIEVMFNYGGNPYRMVRPYRLTPWVNMTCTKEQVRHELGVLTHEIEDSEINLIESYFRMKGWYPDIFDACLAANDSTNLDANLAIVLYTAYRLLPRLRIRIFEMQKSDVIQYQRYGSIDWDALEDDISTRLELATWGLNPNQAVIQPPTLYVGTSADAVTGVGYPYRNWWKQGAANGSGIDSIWLP